MGLLSDADPERRLVLKTAHTSESQVWKAQSGATPIAEYSLRDKQLQFRWLGSSPASDQLRNTLVRVVAGEESKLVAMRKPTPSPMILSLDKRKQTHRIDAKALPDLENLYLAITGPRPVPH